MKAVLISVVLVAGLFAAAWYGGMFKMEDPVEQSKRLREVAQPGAPWEDVVAVRAPRKYAHVNSQRRLGQDDPVPFTRDAFAAAVRDRQSPQGYVFEYAFAADVNYEVEFDAQGKVRRIRDLVTMKDLLEGNVFKKQMEYDTQALSTPMPGDGATVEEEDEGFGFEYEFDVD